MASVEDVRARKRIRSEFTKRMMDTTNMDLQVVHGVVYIRGVIKTIKGGPTDIRAELALIAKIVVNAGLAKDVVLDCTMRGG